MPRSDAMVSPSASSAVASSWTPRALASTTAWRDELEHPVVPRRLQLYGAEAREAVEHPHRGTTADVVGHHEVDLVGPLRQAAATPHEHLDTVDRSDGVDQSLRR